MRLHNNSVRFSIVKAVLASALVLFSAQVFADTKIAVVDFMQVLQQSHEVQQRQDKLKSDLSSQTEQGRKLAGEIKGIEQKMQKDGMTMSDEAKKKLSQEHDAKMIQFRSIQQMVQERMKSEQQDLMQDMEPKIVAAVKAVAEKQGYTLVVASQAVVYSKKDNDITDLVVKQLNSGK